MNQLFIFTCLGWSSLAWGVTQYEAPHRLVFAKSLKELKPSILLPLKVQTEVVKIPYKKMKIRVIKGDDENLVGPLKLYVPVDPEQRQTMILKIAKPGKENLLAKSFAEKVAQQKNPSYKAKIVLDPKDFNLIDPMELSILLSRPHQKIQVLTSKLKPKKEIAKRLVHQLRPFLSRNDLKKVIGKLKRNKTLSLDQDLLPQFARDLVKKFVVLKGPNCFHAALRFQGARYVHSPFYNIKEEQGYHKAMVNYDELWRTLARGFYEINPRQTPLEYGDMIVFFDIPQNLGTGEELNFRWIRHATTYLFNHFTFSKGSKSPSTPYTVKTLADEWTTWQGYSKNLGVKVYRKSYVNAKKQLPMDLIDWIY